MGELIEALQKISDSARGELEEAYTEKQLREALQSIYVEAEKALGSRARGVRALRVGSL